MLMAKQLPQMELYCGIGKAVCRRSEKGAAAMASEYLTQQYPDVKGFSPRSLRRMRDFYRTYEDHPNLLSLALQIGWIQNVVIMEADLTMNLRGWYMNATKQFGWSKAELFVKIAANIHENIVLTIEKETCNIKGKEDMLTQIGRAFSCSDLTSSKILIKKFILRIVPPAKRTLQKLIMYVMLKIPILISGKDAVQSASLRVKRSIFISSSDAIIAYRLQTL